MKKFNDDMFIVVNKKRFKELKDSDPDRSAVIRLIDSLDNFSKVYTKKTGKPLNQKYLVCNQDEPYAERVKAIILGQPDPKDKLIEQMGKALEDAYDDKPGWVDEALEALAAYKEAIK